MKKLLLVPALLLAACGDNLHPDLDQAVGGADTQTDSPGDVPDPGPALVASFETNRVSCPDHSLGFTGVYSYADGTPVTNPICHYDFGDGTSADTCSAVHSYSLGFGNWQPTANVTFTVQDPATGATATYSEGPIVTPGNFDAWLIPSTNGLSISWEAHAFYIDGEVGIDHVSIEPADKVIVDDPSVLTQGVGTVRVTEAGTYTITLHAAMFPGVDGCYVDFPQTVEVTCASSGH